MQPWSDAAISALLITAGLIIPLAAIAVGLRHPGRGSKLERLGQFVLTGTQIRQRPPRPDATEDEIGAWTQEAEQWAQVTVDYLRENCSLRAAAIFIDQSEAQAGSYAGIHPLAQPTLRALNRWLGNLRTILNNADVYVE